MCCFPVERKANHRLEENEDPSSCPQGPRGGLQDGARASFLGKKEGKFRDEMKMKPQVPLQPQIDRHRLPEKSRACVRWPGFAQVFPR